jgi:3-deoxy-D-manno-octulosonic acid (KDO) 8-phosphate synthase
MGSKTTNINFIYKSSYDKANRTSTSSFRGLGIEEGFHGYDLYKNSTLIISFKIVDYDEYT